MITVGPITSNTNTALLDSNGYKIECYLLGTWGGATIKLQSSPDGGTNNWVDVANGSFTANGYIKLDFTAGIKLRAVSSSTSGTTSVSVLLV